MWWKEAAGAWSDKPLEGWGGGSFPVTHLMYRQVELSVLQPHSVALQFLAETGVVGAALAMGSFAFLLFAALARIRGMTEGRERDIAVALFAGACAWLLHGFVDFDWDIPGVTIPALAVPRRARRGTGAPRGPHAAAAPLGSGSAAVAPRAAALALACVVLGLVIVSAWLPQWADSKANSALAISTDAKEPELRKASATAQTGSRLDPTAVRSLLAAADLAQNRGRLLDARRYLLQAVDRQPYNLTAWRRILLLALDTADRRGANAAAQRLLELDPIGIRDGTLSLAGPGDAVRRARRRLPDRDRHAAEPRVLDRPADDADAADPGPEPGAGTATPPPAGSALPRPVAPQPSPARSRSDSPPDEGEARSESGHGSRLVIHQAV